MSRPTAPEMFQAQGVSEQASYQLASALILLSAVPPEELEHAIERIGHMEAIGPIFDPTFFVRTPNTFNNARANRNVLAAALALRRLLPDHPGARLHNDKGTRGAT